MRPAKDRNIMYSKGKENLQKCLKVIDLVENSGFTESSACKECNVKVTEFRRLIRFKVDAESINSDRINNCNRFYSWKDEFLNDVFDGAEDRYVNVYDDFDETFEYVMSTLTDREERIMKLKYIEGLSTREISKEIGVSSARVGQINSQVIKKLRHRERLKYFMYGKKTVDFLDSIRRKNTSCEIKINDLNISIRLRNVLLRNNIFKLEDLVNKTKSEVMKFRYLGRYGMIELEETMNKFGIRFKEEEN